MPKRYMMLRFDSLFWLSETVPASPQVEAGAFITLRTVVTQLRVGSGATLLPCALPLVRCPRRHVSTVTSRKDGCARPPSHRAVGTTLISQIRMTRTSRAVRRVSLPLQLAIVSNGAHPRQGSQSTGIALGPRPFFQPQDPRMTVLPLERLRARRRA